MATIKEIADKAEVSISTVSRILNYDENLNVQDSTRKRVLEIAKKLDYVKVKKIKKKNNAYVIGIAHFFSEEEEEIRHSFYLSIVAAIEKKCADENLKYIRINKFEDLTAVESLDGIIIIGEFCNDITEKLINICQRNITFVDSHFDDIRFDSVLIDFKKAVYDALDFIVEQGHKKIGFIGGKREVCGNEFRTKDYREVAFRKYLEAKTDANIRLKDEFVKVGSFTHEDGYRLMKECLEEKDTPSAFFIANDSMAIGAYKAIIENGLKIPEDISIIGFDDIVTSRYLVPALTSVRVYTDMMGQSAVELFLEKIKSDREISKKVIIPTQLIIRNSCR